MPASAYSKQQKSSKSISTPSAETRQATDVTSVDVTSQSFDAEQILYLQRTIGNQATMKLLQRKPMPDVIQRDTEHVSPVATSSGGDIEDYDLDEYEEGDFEKWREAVNELEPIDFFDDEVVDVEDVVDFSNELALRYIENDGEGMTAKEVEFIQYIAVELQGKMVTSIYDKLIAMPAIGDVVKDKKEMSQFERARQGYELLLEDLRDEDVIPELAPAYLTAREEYFTPIEGVPYTDEFYDIMESEKFSWLLADDMDNIESIKEMATAKETLALAGSDADKIKLDAFSTTMGGAKSSVGVINQMLTVATASETLAKIHEGSKATGKMLGTSLKNLGMWLIGKSFATLAIGYDLLRAFKYHKTRRDGYKAAIERVGIDEKDTDLKPTTAEELMKMGVGEAAIYGYKKTKRALSSTVIKMSLKVVKWIAYAITLLSGGTTAVVTATTALTADIIRSLMNLGEQLKGAFKAITGKRGANRKKYAKILVTLAQEGNADAIQTIWDVNPFDEAQESMKSAWNMSGGKLFGTASKITTIPKPESKDEFTRLITSDRDGYNGKQIKTLINAVAGTMRSK